VTHFSIRASIPGSSHAATGRPCEDHSEVLATPDRRWISAVVCDGCGSAAHARDGAVFISQFVARQLAAMAGDLDHRGPGEWAVDRVIMIMVELREAMRLKFGPSLAGHAATIVGTMLSRNGGFVVHHGDGIASGFAVQDAAGGKVLHQAAQSDPENGEYANETFYVTDPGWLKHLRLTPIGATDCLLLATDGAQAWLYERDRIRHDRLIEMLGELYRTEGEQADARLSALLSAPPVARVSNDDKTLVLLGTDRLWNSIPDLVPPARQAADDGATVPAAAGVPAIRAPGPPGRAAADKMPPGRVAADKMPPDVAGLPEPEVAPRATWFGYRPAHLALMGALALGPVSVLALGYGVWQWHGALLEPFHSLRDLALGPRTPAAVAGSGKDVPVPVPMPGPGPGPVPLPGPGPNGSAGDGEPGGKSRLDGADGPHSGVIDPRMPGGRAGAPSTHL
jgi:hypothetical protein